MRPLEVIVLSVGGEYTRDQINQYVGGSKQSYLPTKGGAVVAACLTREMNPGAPEVVLCGRGKVVGRVGEQLARQFAPIPVFLKLDTNRWQYRGMFKPIDWHTAGKQFVEAVSASKRRSSDVSRVVLLRRVGD